MRLAASGSVAGMVARNWRRRFSLAMARSSLTAVAKLQVSSALAR